jgi:hypothetical protein
LTACYCLWVFASLLGRWLAVGNFTCRYINHVLRPLVQIPRAF